MFSFRTFYQTLPSGSPFARYKRGSGSKLITRSGVFEIPVAEWLKHSFSVGFTYAFITSPLQVLYTRRLGDAYLWALQTSWRGWAYSKAVHSMECIGARSLYWRTLSVGAAACSALYCQRWEVYPPTSNSNYPTKNQNNRLSRSCARVVYI